MKKTKLNQKVKKICAGAALVAGLSQGAIQAQPAVHIEARESLEHPESFVRTNIFHDVKDLKGYTFIDLYGPHGYFGKTTLSKQIKGPLSSIVQAVYGSDFETKYGAGLSLESTLGESAFGKVHIIPAWTTKAEFRDVMKPTVGYFVTVDLPKGFTLSSFGEATIGKKSEWKYGEITLEKKLSDKVSVRYHPALRSQGKLKPRYEHGIGIKVKL